MVKVKICGITNLDDALCSAGYGADALGFVFWSGSPRHVKARQAAAITAKLPPFVMRVGVFVNEAPSVVNSIIRDAGLDAVQLHGEEPPSYCARIKGARVIKAFRVKDGDVLALMEKYRACAYLLDAFKEGVPGGTGRVFDWKIAARAGKSGRAIILSGGLTPDNVSEAVRRVRPYAVDVSSGVERAPGKKDRAKLKKFILQAKYNEKIAG